MTTSSEKSLEANRLRKSGELEKALPLYRELCADARDQYSVAGLLHCLRKTNHFEEAIPLCNVVFSHFLDSEWCRNEAIWTLIQGQLEKLEEGTPVEKVVSIAHEIFSFGPTEPSTKWRIIRRVLKAAKARARWDIVSEWIDRVAPEELSDEPMKTENGREGWCDQAIWHNLKIRSMIEVGDKEKAIELSKGVSNIFPRQCRFFGRLTALATLRLSRTIEAERLYADLCNARTPDWWIMHEYAQVLKELGKRELALKMMCKAASSHQKLDSLVSLFFDLGTLCLEMENRDAACNHLSLCKFVRQEHGWSIPYSLEKSLEELESNPNNPTTLAQALLNCRDFWKNTIGPQGDWHEHSFGKRKPRAGLTGKVSLGPSDRPFCFISIESGESFFCYKSDLPRNIAEGTKLVFDAIPSFDKKKKRESWKVANIRITDPERG